MSLKLSKIDIRWLFFAVISVVFAITQIKLFMYAILLFQLGYLLLSKKQNRASESMNLLFASVFMPDNYCVIAVIFILFILFNRRLNYWKGIAIALISVIYVICNILINMVPVANVVMSIIYMLPFFLVNIVISWTVEDDENIKEKVVLSLKFWIVIELFAVLSFAVTHFGLVQTYNDMDWVTGTLGVYQCNVLMCICAFALLVFLNNVSSNMVMICICGILIISTTAIAYTMIFVASIGIIYFLSLKVKATQKITAILLMAVGVVGFIMIVPKWISNEMVKLLNIEYLTNRVRKIGYYINTFVEIPKNEGIWSFLFGSGLGQYSSRTAETCAGGYIELFDKISPSFETPMRIKYISSLSQGEVSLAASSYSSIISTQGELGLVGLLGLLGYFCYKLKKARSVGAMIAIVFFVGLMTVDNALEFAKYGVMLWMAYYLCDRRLNRT